MTTPVDQLLGGDFLTPAAALPLDHEEKQDAAGEIYSSP